jgi:superfamily I DNA/RNA helicase
LKIRPDFMPLSTEQIDIVDLPLNDKLLVTAGPGTGKTYTLVARLAHLIQENDIAPGHELLVLSFSRAAVRELRNRCAAVGGDLSYVNITTFDSYATKLLSWIEPDGIWISESYDGRIEHAIELIQSGQTDDFLCEIKHIFVDEIQDLVGIRAKFVKTILEAVNAGFSLFGDPAQGIYNFQLDNPAEREIGSAELYEWVRKNFKSELVEKKLTENYRAATNAAKTALWAGDRLNREAPDFENIYDCLTTDLWELTVFGNHRNFADRLKKVKGTVAVLCRNNGQALMLSRKLHEFKIEHVLKRGADDRMIPTWIARVLSHAKNSLLSKAAFADFCLEEGIEESEIEEKWQILKKAEGESTRNLDLSILNIKCRRSSIPDWINEERTLPIVVSSIHRAKGLEFETVIIAAHEGFEDEAEYIAEECRNLYVAMTRPKRNLYLLKLQKFWGLCLNEQCGRWIKRGTGRNDWKVIDFEVKFTDTDKTEPPCSVTGRRTSVSDIQTYIATNVRPGDCVELVRVGSDERNREAVYHIMHSNFLIGKTVPGFASELLFTIRNCWRRGALPKKIGPLPVEGVETVFGDSAVLREKNLENSAGVWLGVRVGGLGKLNFRGD